MARIFLTGARGQVGSEVELALLQQGHHVISCTHQSLDITDSDRITSAIEESNPDVVINSAAYTNVEKAELEPDNCFAVNTIGVVNLVNVCKSLDIPLIHISTDYVFYDNLNRPHTEDDPTSSLCVYGQSKLKAEDYIINSGCKYLIIRSSWIFGRFGSNFVKSMLSLSKIRQELAVVSDQIGNPTPAHALGSVLAYLATLASDKSFDKFGIYHYASANATTWDQFARKIFQKAKELNVLQHDMNVVSVYSEEFKTIAKRPKNSQLDSHKIKYTFGITLPNWEDYLEETILAWVNQENGLPVTDDYHYISSYDDPNLVLSQEQSLQHLIALQQQAISRLGANPNDYPQPTLD